MTKEYKVIGGGMYSGFVEWDIPDTPKVLSRCNLCEDIQCFDAPEGRYGTVKGIGTGKSEKRIKDCPIRKMKLEENEVEDFFDKNNIGA